MVREVRASPERRRRRACNLPDTVRRATLVDPAMPEGYPWSTTNRRAEAATMPEFTVKEVRLPELHLPEVKRDEIVRALSGIRVPEVDRAIAEPRRRLRTLDL